MIRFEHISAGYGDVAAVRDFSLEVAPGECILLSGRNGSGKTTLMKTLAGLLKPLSGTLPAAEIVMVPTRIPKVKGFTVREFISLTAEGPVAGRAATATARVGRAATSPAVADGPVTVAERVDHALASPAVADGPVTVAARVDYALSVLGICDLAGRDISTLSDGQFQKACIATGLSRRADLILLDEPTAFLDAESRVEVLAAIRDAARSGGAAILFSSHDLHEARKVADREIALSAG